MSTGTHQGSDFMKEYDEEQLAKFLVNELEKRRTIDINTHRKHHEYIDRIIKEHEIGQNRREQWIRVVGGWGIITAFSGIGLAVWYFIKDQLK